MMGDWDTWRVSGKQGGANVRRHVAAGVHYRPTELSWSSAGAAKVDVGRWRWAFGAHDQVLTRRSWASVVSRRFCLVCIIVGEGGWRRQHVTALTGCLWIGGGGERGR